MQPFGLFDTEALGEPRAPRDNHDLTVPRRSHLSGNLVDRFVGEVVAYDGLALSCGNRAQRSDECVAGC